MHEYFFCTFSAELHYIRIQNIRKVAIIATYFDAYTSMITKWDQRGSWSLILEFLQYILLKHNWNWKALYLSNHNVNLKVTKTQKVFHFGSNLQKKGAKSQSWGLFLKRRYSWQSVIWHLYVEIGAKVKKTTEILRP